jgi:uncharacterized protein
MNAVHGGVFLAALAIGGFVPGLATWPLYLLVPITGYLVLVACMPPLRRSFPGFPLGRMNGLSTLASVVIILVSSAVLIGYHALVAPDVRPLAERLPFAAWDSLLLAGVCFSVGNAVLEEISFRGGLYDALDSEWGWLTAMAITSVMFGLVHQAGYPSGSLGMVLAGFYGLALGLLRRWSGGLLLPAMCHVCADATIFGILVYAGTFENVSS